MIIVLGLLVALGPLTIDMYLPALPKIADELSLSSSVAQLTLTGTLAGLALGQLIVGPLSDSLGRKKPLIAGILLHMAASLLCLFATNIATLGIARGLQGVGAAAMLSIGPSMYRLIFPSRLLGSAIGMGALVVAFGIASMFLDADSSLGMLRMLRVLRPLRSKHSGHAKKCVPRFDHNCPWVKNAIGYRNHPLFMLYVVCALGALGSTGSLCSSSDRRFET